ncbi:TonB-dependent receptor [Novosphingobium marinum]|uniref:Outer membrane receptor protein involved in Fe transport n=1 Tax=Novosphingobium marinum TaxID=1514948 RepID=A0A7Y9XY98_9SPHN|nr:TonB-dependent receptor [Novosphingobium marinum]NYH96839.1 outer membrane receptor protein involved in Fe transport [Novosphingobium marinum]GGC39839.1 TonB-dependent receptor [Novosphingobium marinum]
MQAKLQSKSIRRASLLLSAASAALLVTPAMAQDVPPPSNRGEMSDAGPAAGIGDIVVTARKRQETTQDVPVAITAIGEETIERYDLTSLERIAASTPQFTVGRAGTGSGATLVLRGIGSNTTSIGLEQSVAVVVDSVYYGQGRTINEGFFDLGQVEILKGPQALFFGKNATAGVVSMTTKNPGPDFEVIVRGGFEFNADELTGEAIVSGPVSDTLGVRAGVRYSKQYETLFPNRGEAETWRLTDVATGTTRFIPATMADDEPGTRDFLARVTVLWEPTNQLTATLKASYNNVWNDNPLSNYVIYQCPNGVSQLNPAVPCGRDFRIYQSGGPEEVGADIPFGFDDGSLGNDYEAFSVTGTLNFDAGAFDVTNVTNYNWNRNIFRIDANSVAASPVGLYATEDTDFQAWSNELRVLSGLDGPFNFMIGGLYQWTKRDYDAWTAQAGLENSAAPEGFRFVGNSKDSQTRGETIAVFGQAIFKPIEQIEIAGGVRYTHETKESYFLQPYSNPVLVNLGVFSPGVVLNADQSFDNWSPEVTVTWQPSDEVTIYGAFKTAYKSGGFSNSGIYGPRASVDDFTFGPETAEGFEAGIKTQLLDRQLRLNLGAFWYKYDDIQIDFFNSPVFAFTTYNAASAITKGVEMDFQFAPRALYGFEIHGSLNYNEAKYDEFSDAPCYTGQTPAQGCYTVTPRPQQDLGGTVLANAPKWTGSFGGSYELPLATNLLLGIAADARYKSSYLASAFGHPLTRQDEYVVLDAQVRLATEDDRLELALVGKNLTNKFYYNGAQDAPSTGGGTGLATGFVADQIGYIASPRTVKMQITVRY